MKTYEVEMKRTGYVVITVDANSKEEAEQLAWTEIQENPDYMSNYADWEVESIGWEDFK